jgi:hypothetical protein
MQVNGPRELPDFRLWLIDQWRVGGFFDRVASLQQQAGAAWTEDGELVFNLNPPTQRKFLPKAELWWVTEDMAGLIDHSAKTLPETTLNDDLVPADYGLIRFARPLMGTQSDTGESISTHAIVWGRRTRKRDNFASILITSYEFKAKGEEMGNAVYGYTTAPQDMWAPTGSTTWTWGVNTDEVAWQGFEGQDVRNDSMAEDRRWLAATWLLASQPLAASVTHKAERSVGRRSQRANVDSDVRVVDLRPRPRREPGDGEDSQRKEHDHRWIVGGPNGDGFWRQQACGPGWSERRPKWILPYVAGPDDKPLRVKETVRVLRGD